MKKRRIALAALALVGIGAGTAAYVASPTMHEGAAGEMPELGRYGEFAVGTQEIAIALPDRVTFTKAGMLTGSVQREDRVLQVRFYYPAEAASEEGLVTYRHTIAPPDMEPVTLEYAGRAFVGAPATGEADSFPLVVMSHGFGGWSTQFSNLAEHIASRGYVVASIDHADRNLEGLTDFVHSFAEVLASRSLDQRQVIEQIVSEAAGGSGHYALIDSDRIGLIGYSMGGYGAIATAGGDYDYESGTFSSVPDTAMGPVKAVASADAGIDALVAFAPWGGAPGNRVWSADALANVTTPVLIVAGNQDDVSGFEDGISWIFGAMTGADRKMLVFREARHNIVGNAFEQGEDVPFRAIEFVNEPVWRQDRINGINQHFVAAFLDLHLKGDADKAAYLDVPTTDANDSQWETSFGEQLNGKMAGDDEPQHWRGFQRRWALGLEMYSKTAGE